MKPVLEDKPPRYWVQIRFAIIILGVLFITWLMPKGNRFKFEYSLGQEWNHPDLRAPMTYPVDKDKESYNNELNRIRTQFKPYVRKDLKTKDLTLEAFNGALDSIEADMKVVSKSNIAIKNRAQILLDSVYNIGILEPALLSAKGKADYFNEILANTITEKLFEEYLSLTEAKKIVKEKISYLPDSTKNIVWNALTVNIIPNIHKDTAINSIKLNELLETVSPNIGVVNLGDVIVSKGNIVTKNIHLKLLSLHNYYDKNSESNLDDILTFLGYLILIILLVSIYSFQINVTNPEIHNQPRAFLAVIFLILFTLVMTSFFARSDNISVYLVPFCTVPILLLAFFKQRLAILTHILLVFLASFMVPNPFEFMVIQIIAGFVAVISMLKIRFLSQFFVSTILVFLSYCISFIALSFLHISKINEVDYTQFIWFSGNFILTLLTYPLIYANEKVFGLVSDISLLEWNDVNSPLLKDLSEKAPGTFQHSLQVANISEAVVSELGGNSLLTRVGALYHDIGKMSNPQYFTENQNANYNPHDALPEEQSAEIIIKHVENGIELAKKTNLPERLIDFIRTHHGTTRVEYFYQRAVLSHLNEFVDEGSYRYNGPKPYSKEMAVLMIVDSIEAAAHSLKDPDEDSLEHLVDAIIDHKIDDRQFSDAPITLQEIETTRKIVKRLLKSIYHARIKYPEVG